MPPIQDDVDGLVRDILAHATRHVFFAIAADEVLLKRYNALCKEHGSKTTNKEIGKAVKRTLNAGTIKDGELTVKVPNLSNLITRYTRHEFKQST